MEDRNVQFTTDKGFKTIARRYCPFHAPPLWLLSSLIDTHRSFKFLTKLPPVAMFLENRVQFDPQSKSVPYLNHAYHLVPFPNPFVLQAKKATNQLDFPFDVDLEIFLDKNRAH